MEKDAAKRNNRQNKNVKNVDMINKEHVKSIYKELIVTLYYDVFQTLKKREKSTIANR